MSETSGSDWSKTGDNWWFDVISDDAHKGSTDSDQADLFLLEIFDWTSSNPYTTGRWRALYAGTNRANAVIDLISQIEGGDFTQQMAEARFLRGYYNFQLQRIWGNVAYISEENYAKTEFNQPNSGPIWAQIEADFDFAMKNLKDDTNEVGRPVSWTATAFMGKILLYQHKYAEALGFLETVINLGPYKLLPEFVDNFRLAGDNSVESLFAIQFAADDGQSYNGNRVLDTYNQTDVANDYGINSDEAFTPETGPLDPRLDYTVGRRGIDFNGWGVNVGKDWIRATFADISGPYLAKKSMYYAGEDANMGTGGWGQQRAGIN